RELRNWGFSVASIAGAYWRGESDRPVLQRVYVHAFPSTKELKAYHKFLEEAKKRDHRTLGVQHDLFDLYPEGPGFPFFFPKGMVLRNLVEEFWRKTHTKFGYTEIKTPIILNQDLWHRSGHWEHYRDNMYTTTIDETDFAVKPMNCPGAMLVFKRKLHSYRDLPQRMGELGLVHRHELSGTLHGLMRVRCFTQDDAHIFMTKEQIKDEIKNAINMFTTVYETFGFENIRVELSTRPENSMGADEDWEVATKALNDVLDELEMNYVLNEGDGAFYGPKIDFHLSDCIGRTWQCGTIQLDFQMPERFNLTYVGADNTKHRPIMVHHTTLGSIERFMGVITEHFAARFPFWLSPVQVGIVPVHDEHNTYADSIKDQLEEAGFRVNVDKSSGTMGNKIKSYRNELTPYVIILGDKEVQEGTISLRVRTGTQLNSISLEGFIDACKLMNKEHKLDLIEEV
ncbi:MAG: threonine--tRNA ligase, partial [Defluviitaleaceae bacterium]|nr:threonine--tRNA ligase [Defluviitaleaceae bacterium]